MPDFKLESGLIRYWIIDSRGYLVGEEMSRSFYESLGVADPEDSRALELVSEMRRNLLDV